MKQLELELKKRLLIVEPENDQLEKSLMFADFEGKELSFICKGNDLSEDKLKNFITKGWNFTRVESFISAIESKGYYWGRSPIAEPNVPPFINPNSNGYSENDYVDYRYDLHQFYEAKSRTFNPEKTLIFEML